MAWEKTVLDAQALGAKVPEYRALDISDYDQVAAFAADIHTSHPAMDVVMNIAGGRRGAPSTNSRISIGSR